MAFYLSQLEIPNNKFQNIMKILPNPNTTKSKIPAKRDPALFIKVIWRENPKSQIQNLYKLITIIYTLGF